MEKVVYLLGAGFSAPLGLPVVSNFLGKSRDLYFRNKVKYEYFLKVFKMIDDLHKIKNYYDADFFNIEEILSVLEMRNLLSEKYSKDLFRNFIADVIEFW